jgi:hypothetical protein
MMMQATFVVSLMVVMTCVASESQPSETTIRLPVPKSVAAGSAPVLMIEGFEYTLGERLTLEVLGPPDRKTKKRPVLAVESLVGSNRPPKDAPKEKMDLVVPLNDDGVRLVAKKKEVTLTLRVRKANRPLKFARAYLTSR